MNFGKVLRKLRLEKKLLQKDIANILSITPSAYGFYEQNRRNPDIQTLNKLTEFFDVTTDYLLGRTDTRYPSTKEQSKITELTCYQLTKKENESLNKFIIATIAQAKYNLHLEEMRFDEESMQNVEVALRESFIMALINNRKK